AKAAELLLIFDSCHSGSGMRAGSDDTSRHIEPEALIPAAVLAAAQARANATRDERPSSEPAFDPLERGRWAALYAALPDEPTMEATLPKRGPGGRRHGLFTYNLCQALRQSAVPSYRELVQRIRSQYMARGLYTSPTPLVEGTDLDRTLLGAKRSPLSFQLE